MFVFTARARRAPGGSVALSTDFAITRSLGVWYPTLRGQLTDRGHCDTYSQFSDVEFAEVQIEGLKSQIQIHSKSMANQRVYRETYTGKNSKPQGLEENIKHETENAMAKRQNGKTVKR